MRGEGAQIPRMVEVRSAAAAARILLRALGPRATAAVLAEVAAATIRGEPFSELSPPDDRREELSRRQCAPAILLHRALRRRLDADRALSITGEVVLAGTIHFLSFALGRPSRAELLSMSEREREGWLGGLGERFFNATIRWDEVSAQRLMMTVTRCRFPELCEAAGAPEVAPLLCQGDAVYFGEVLGTIELRRPHTLAEGAESCPFELRWR